MLSAKMSTSVKKRKQAGGDSVFSSIWLRLIFAILQRCWSYRFVVVVVVVVAVVFAVAVIVVVVAVVVVVIKMTSGQS